MTLTEKTIAALEAKGFNRWTKGNMDRLYINATHLGLELTYYKTGNISSAYMNGERISNAQGYRYKAAKTYIDIQTGEVHSDRDDLKEAAQELLNSVDDTIKSNVMEELTAQR